MSKFVKKFQALSGLDSVARYIWRRKYLSTENTRAIELSNDVANGLDALERITTEPAVWWSHRLLLAHVHAHHHYGVVAMKRIFVLIFFSLLIIPAAYANENQARLLAALTVLDEARSTYKPEIDTTNALMFLGECVALASALLDGEMAGIKTWSNPVFRQYTRPYASQAFFCGEVAERQALHLERIRASSRIVNTIRHVGKIMTSIR